MGVAATIGATLLGGFISGRAQQQQYNAAAQQAEVNAQIANQNADKLQAQAEEQSKISLRALGPIAQNSSL